jgi:hypothetical protein
MSIRRMHERGLLTIDTDQTSHQGCVEEPDSVQVPYPHAIGVLHITHSPCDWDQVQYGFSEGSDGLTDLEDVLQYRYYCIATYQ